jgi:hypothetical protein
LQVLSDYLQPFVDVLDTKLVMPRCVSPSRVLKEREGVLRASAFEGEVGQSRERVRDPALPPRWFKDARSPL